LPAASVVINEIHYHPPDIGGTNDNAVDEFLELYNPTAAPVPLFNTNGAWRLDGEVNWTLPLNLTLAPGEYLLVVNFDPLADPAQLAAFRTLYALTDPGLRIGGPYNGKLANSSARVALEKPQAPGTAGGSVSWVIVDEVLYADQSPWPCGTDGTGASLQRQAYTGSGSNPLQWAGGPPTPGRTNVSLPPGAPIITVPPSDRIVGTNTPATFSVVVCGPPPYFYQWRFNGGNIPQATNAQFTIASAEMSNAGLYSVVVSNAAGGVVSPAARLIVQLPPFIVAQPQSRTNVQFETATLSVEAGGTLPLFYQWRFNGTALAGATNATLLLTNVEPNQAGVYSVVVWNAAASVASAPATLVVRPLPVITLEPADQKVPPGTNAVLTVVATGTGLLTYQWQFNGADLPGATASTLVLTNAGLQHTGLYRVRVTDTVGTRVSREASIYVLVRPTIVQQPSPVNQVVAVGETVELTAEATGALPLLCRWRRNGNTNIAVEAGFTLTLTNVTHNEAGFYDVVITNLAGGSSPAVSARAYVAVVEPPAKRGVMPGSDVTLRALTRSPGPATNYFWWLHNGATVLREGTNITPSQTSVWFTNDLALPGVTAAHAGTYTLLMSNVMVVSSNLHVTTRAFTSILAVGDTTPPEINCPANLTLDTDPGQCSAQRLFVPEATDNVSVAGTVCAPLGPYPLGLTTVTCWAWDVSGNSNSCSFTVTVGDTQPPVVAVCPGPQTLTAEAGGSVALPDLRGGVTAMDNCGPVALTQSPEPGSLLGGGTHSVTLTVRDDAGNTATCQTPVTVEVPVAAITLTIEFDGASAVIRWPDLPGDWTLQEASGLASPLNWQTSGAQRTLLNGRWQAVVPLVPGTNKFYQLKQP
jgi:uncharacterized protein YjbI with pentapeptide repeats